ncbi:MAG: hypothetical protein MUC62_10065 [Candidatus Thermoplasmatota archaeon]|nr:hypothetical protein [Candidatus Thermoplasmatota archaeon]
MRYYRYLAMFTFLLLVSGAALAVKHHENYDSALVDMQVLKGYLKDALDAMNESLEHCMVLESEEALVWSAEYSRKVGAAEQTLDRIPDEVDSYSVLLRYLTGLVRIEVNLTGTVTALSKAVLASKVISLDDDPVWSEAAIRENLTALDKAFLDLESGLTMLKPYSAALVEDLISFEGLGHDVRYQIFLAEEVGGLGENISSGPEGPWALLSRFMVHPMASWSLETGRLASEEALDLELERCSDILQSVLPLLTGGMKVPVGSVTPPLEDAASSSSSFFTNQTVFLFSIDLLEMNRTGLSEGIHHFQRCGYAIIGMENDLSSMEEDLSTLSAYDNGSVGSGLEALEALLESYRKRLLEVELLDTRFEALTELVNRTFWSNVLNVDPDGDGKLSAEEVSAISIGSGPSGLKEALEAKWASLRSELMSLPEWMMADIVGTMVLIEDLVQGAVQFTTSHYDLVRYLSLLLNVTRSEDRFNALQGFLGDLSVMMNIVESLPGTERSLLETGIAAPALYTVPLERMLQVYKGYLLDIAKQINETLLSIRVWPSVVPYDSSAAYSVMMMNRDGTGAIMLADGSMVDVSLDGVNIGRLTVDDGMANGTFMIERDMALGEHILQAECNDSAGRSINDSDVITIRRLVTVLSLSAARTIIDIEGNVTVRAEARDELLRPYKGTIFLGDDHYPIEGHVDVLIMFDRVGEHLLIGTIPVTDHFDGAVFSILFMVDIGSVMTLTVDRTPVFVDEELVLEVTVSMGEGQVFLLLDDRETGIGMMGNGTRRALSVNASELGPGKHVLQARLLTTVRWARNGWSDPVQVEVLERVQEDELPPVPNDTVPWDDEVPKTFWDHLFPEWGFLESLLFRIVLISLLAISFAVIIVVLVVRFRRGRSGSGGTKLPRLYMKKRVKTVVEKKGLDQIDDGQVGKGEPKAGPPAPFTKDRNDPDRKELIRMYLELIDGSSELGIKRSMTHREAASRLSELGLDRNLSERLSSNFERSIYAKGVPGRSDLNDFGRDKGSATGYITSLRERLRPILGPGRGTG